MKMGSKVQSIGPQCYMHSYWPSCHDMQKLFSCTFLEIVNCFFDYSILERSVETTVGDGLIPLVNECSAKRLLSQ